MTVEPVESGRVVAVEHNGQGQWLLLLVLVLLETFELSVRSLA
jgi:hypothetical protein